MTEPKTDQPSVGTTVQYYGFRTHEPSVPLAAIVVGHSDANYSYDAVHLAVFRPPHGRLGDEKPGALEWANNVPGPGDDSWDHSHWRPVLAEAA